MAAVLLVVLLSAAAPQLITLTQAAVPLVLAVGIVAVILRVVWHFTRY